MVCHVFWALCVPRLQVTSHFCNKRYIRDSSARVDTSDDKVGERSFACATIKRSETEKSSSRLFSKKVFNPAINSDENEFFLPAPILRHNSKRLTLLEHDDGIAGSASVSLSLSHSMCCFHCRSWLVCTLYLRATRLTLRGSA